jgi:hypothetical protein
MTKSQLKQLINEVISEMMPYIPRKPGPEEYTIAVPKVHAKKAFEMIQKLSKNKKYGLTDPYLNDDSSRADKLDRKNWVDIDLMIMVPGGIDIEDVVELLEKNGIETQ